MRRTAYLICKHGAIKLDADLRWQADSDLVRKLAETFVPIEYGEGDGDPHAFLIGKLQQRLGGEITFGEEG